MKKITEIILLLIITCFSLNIGFKQNVFATKIDEAIYNCPAYDINEILEYHYGNLDNVPSDGSWRMKEVALLDEYYQNTGAYSEECYQLHRETAALYEGYAKKGHNNSINNTVVEDFEPGYQNESRAVVLDKAQLLTQQETNALLSSMEKDVKENNYDIAIVTVGSINGETPHIAAHEFIDQLELGWHNPNGGILLLLSMAERDWYIATYGPATKVVTDTRISNIGNSMVNYLSNGNYYNGFLTFTNEVKHYFENQNALFAIRAFEDYPEISLGLIIFVILSTIFVPRHFIKQMNNIKKDDNAARYVARESVNLLDRSDVYLRQEVHRTSKSSSSGGGGSRSSGGGSRGGGGGKF